MSAVLGAGCAQLVHAPARVAPIEFNRPLALHDRPMVTHLAVPSAPSDRPLIVYATGDGGWRGKDLEVYQKLVAWGYPTIGFSSPDYLQRLAGKAKTTTPGDLARDYNVLVDFAKSWLRLPAARQTVLVGVSRGADLAVAAAGQTPLQRELGGVVAIGLTREEEYVLDSAEPVIQVGVLKLYDYLPHLGVLPISVVQSTHDSYVPADIARALLGPDTDRRQLHAISSSNHSFGGARPAMYDAIEASLEWIDGLLAGEETAR